MNIYLDIDGVLLANDAHASLHVDDFIDKCISTGADIYWLTTWCRGEENQAVRWLSQSNMNPETIAKLEKHCRVTNWDVAKTEAIDFNVPFLWFDDDLFTFERAELLKHNALDNWIGVDLRKDPEELQRFVSSFPIPIELTRV